MNVKDIRQELKNRWLNNEVIEGRGGATVEIIGAAFLANEATIFGTPNTSYVKKELDWYATQSLTLFPDAPTAWKTCAGVAGTVNSNYGWCLDSKENGSQRSHVVAELRRQPHSRRAIAIYNRPSMHIDATEGGKQDFICTNAVEYYLRDGRIDCVVQMRSSDAVLGYRNDHAWHLHVLRQLAEELCVEVGRIYWQAGSLHIYERHFFYLEQI